MQHLHPGAGCETLSVLGPQPSRLDAIRGLIDGLLSKLGQEPGTYEIILFKII
jgi:hypothetical protein